MKTPWWQDYDETYEDALKRADPSMRIQNLWGDPVHYFKEFVEPYVKGKDSLSAIEIGAGFGRYTDVLVNYCSAIYAVESSQTCLAYLADHCLSVVSPLHFTELKLVREKLDLAISFSTFCHFNKHEIWWYFRRLAFMLNDGAPIIIHYMAFDLDGIKQFKKSFHDEFGHRDRYEYHDPFAIEQLAKIAGFEKMSDMAPSNALVAGHRVYIGRRAKK